MKNYFAFICAILFCMAYTSARSAVLTTRKDTSEIKKYAAVITPSTISKRGLITIHRSGEKYYFEVDEHCFGKDLLLVTRISQGPAGINSADYHYPGDEVANEVIRFEKGPDNRIFIRKVINNDFMGDTTAAMYTAVKENNLMPIIAGFKIIAFSDDRQRCVFEVTDLINGDNQLFSLNGAERGANNLAGWQKDKSYIEQVACYPQHVEIRHIKTYAYERKERLGTINSSTTFELNTSIIALPEHPMQQRFIDQRIGYFSVGQRDFDSDRNGIKARSFIWRWRLEPKPEDRSKYQRGELVEPQKQIVFYIDPATPEQWVPYLIKGVKAWNKAFEKAGFKNAITAKPAPTKEQDSTFNIYDAQHSAIVYKASDIQNALGYSIADPRTGEILESHISWYHNVIQLLHDGYFTACAAVDPAAREKTFPDSLMGKLITYAISHEIGHALGLKHNMGASAMVPTDSLRSEQWLEQNGICPSIMDYARYNYVAQPEDRIQQDQLIARIGAYDEWAIEWGYKWYPEYHSPEQEWGAIADLTTKRLKNKKLWYGEQGAWDPRAQSGSLGNDQVRSGIYGIKNLKYMISRLPEWTQRPGESYQSLNTAYTNLQRQFAAYLGYAIDQVGGTTETITLSTERQSVYAAIAAEKQIAALRFIDQQLFHPPTWLADSIILSRTGQTASGVIGNLNYSVTRDLVGRSGKAGFILARNEASLGQTKFTLELFLNTLEHDVWSELYTHRPITFYRRNLQIFYLMNASSLLMDDSRALSGYLTSPISGGIPLFANNGDASQFGHLKDLQKLIQKNIKFTTDKETRHHLEYCNDQLNRLVHIGLTTTITNR